MAREIEQLETLSMTNIYLKLVEDARSLPASFTAMGTRVETFDTTTDGPTITGWHICQFASGKTPSDWTNEFHLLVDQSGGLWELSRSQHYDDEGTGVYRYRSLRQVNAEQLRVWDTHGWNFAKMRQSIQDLV
jgi:hypothetical protein